MVHTPPAFTNSQLTTEAILSSNHVVPPNDQMTMSRDLSDDSSREIMRTQGETPRFYRCLHVDLILFFYSYVPS